MSKVAKKWGRFLRATRKRGGEESVFGRVEFVCIGRFTIFLQKLRNPEHLSECLFGQDIISSPSSLLLVNAVSPKYPSHAMVTSSVGRVWVNLSDWGK